MNISYIIIAILTIAIYIISYNYRKVKRLADERIELNENIKIQNEQLEQENLILHNKQDSLNITISTLSQVADEAIKMQSEVITSKVKEHEDFLNQEFERKKQLYEKFIEDFKNEYLVIMQDSSSEIHNSILEKNNELKSAEDVLEFTENQIKEKQEQYQSFCNVLKSLESSDEDKKYLLQISPIDKEEVKKLKEICNILRNPEPLYKAIYKTYFENAYTDLVGRVIGSDKHCGIYCITCKTTGMSYIGQSVDIAERWRQHIKAGCGIGSSNNKLYSAMKEYGVEDFSFKVLEKCPRESLNEKEKYWISLMETNVWGYNMTGGGS